MNSYARYSEEELIEHFSQFLVDSWSYSKVSSFSRNQKSFEMSYVYGFHGKSSATTIAGNAYHESLRFFFEQYKLGNSTDLVTLTNVSNAYIDNVYPNSWKLQKTTPTIEKAKEKAVTTSTKLIENFLAENGLYLQDCEEILYVEVKDKAFVDVNGVEIPLPLSFVSDLVIRTKYGKVAVIDHKSKAAYTSDEDIKLTSGKQAITYVLGLEATKGLQIDEVWFIENKHSQNKDGSPQLNKHVIDMADVNTRRLYEALLYEPLRAMIMAVSDPDYVYLVNDSDNFQDKSELYEFWAKTLISEVEDFNVDPSKKELIKKRIKKIRDSNIKSLDAKVIREFRRNASEFITYDYTNKEMTKQEKIEHVLRRFGIITKVAHMFDGYSSDTYLLEVAAGTKIASIYAYKLDLAAALDVSGVRVSNSLIVYEGKSYLGIEVSKKRVRDLLFNPQDLEAMKIPIGKDNLGQIVKWDLNNHATPHVLVCGSTGSGKSVALVSIIEYAKLAGVATIIILDPKYEFANFRLSGVEIYSDIEDIEAIIALQVDEMNSRVKQNVSVKTLIIFDEFADAQLNSRSGKQLERYEMQVVGVNAKGQAKQARVKVGEDKSLEENMRLLLQKGRSVGFRIVSATQRASSKIITGDAKANYPVQICFRVPKEVDSRVVLDEAGAETLAGYGDGLIKSPEYPELVRFQSYYKPNNI